MNERQGAFVLALVVVGFIAGSALITFRLWGLPW